MRIKSRLKSKKAFTIVELLTVMSIIIILIGLLVPALNQVKRYAKEVRQRAQFHSIDVAMELFYTENDGYPPSNQVDGEGNPYCGAMKLAEAMVGQDLGGFHRDSLFRADLRDAEGDYLYQVPGKPPLAEPKKNKQARMGPYLQLENANATRLVPYDPGGNMPVTPGIYQEGSLDNFSDDMETIFVLCDVYTKTMTNGYKTGMPILYYKANLNGDGIPTPEPGNTFTENSDEGELIYDHRDNQDLVHEGVPWSATEVHPMDAEDPKGDVEENFYYRIWNQDIPLQDGRPYRSDSYILLSAGYDGLYGTRDDIYNFQP